MVLQGFQSDYNSSCSKDQKLQLTCFLNKPIPFQHSILGLSLIPTIIEADVEKKEKGVIKINVKYYNGRKKKPHASLFYSFPKTEFEICLIALFYTLITDDSGPAQIWQ